MPIALPAALGSVARLALHCRGHKVIVSHGMRSHALFLFLMPWLGARLILDIRDFIRPLPLRRMLASAAIRFGTRIRVNSRAVGRDYPGAQVVYPRVDFIPLPRLRTGSRLVVAHLAFFAPYKGQDLFLQTARRALDAGIDADFWMVGDVIYPQKIYGRYRESLHRLAGELGLKERVRFWGNAGNGITAPSVKELLAGTDLLLHCTREPEPFGRVIIEGLRAGCEVICHRESGACERLKVHEEFPPPFQALRNILPPEYVRVTSEERRPSS